MRTALWTRNTDPLAPPAQAFDPTPPSANALDYQGGRPVRQFQKSWRGMSANLAEVRCDGNLHVDLGEDDARLSVVLEEVGGRFEVRARTLPGQALPLGSPQPLSILPPDCAAHGSSAQMHFMRHLFLRFDLGIRAGMAEDEIDVSSALRPRLMFHDPGIMRLAQLI